jgi:hypothetical protein
MQRCVPKTYRSQEEEMAARPLPSIAHCRLSEWPDGGLKSFHDLVDLIAHFC